MILCLVREYVVADERGGGRRIAALFETHNLFPCQVANDVAEFAQERGTEDL